MEAAQRKGGGAFVTIGGNLSAKNGKWSRKTDAFSLAEKPNCKDESPCATARETVVGVQGRGGQRQHFVKNA